MVPEGPKLIAVGERLGAKPTGIMSKDWRPWKGQTIKPSSTLSGSDDVTAWFRGLRAKPLAHGY